MISPQPVKLEGEEHGDALVAAAGDGRLWELWFVAVPPPDGMRAYVADALKGQRDGNMLPWVVRDGMSGAIIGSGEWPDVRRHLELRLDRHRGEDA